MIRSSFDRAKRFAFLVAVILITGCGGGAGDDVVRYPVSGTVNFDGAAIVDGEIRFVSDDGSRVAAGNIKNGAFNLEATPGKKRVEVYANREIPGETVASAVSPDGTEPATEMYIPEKYNAQSTLDADVSADKENTFTFALDP